jgi:hypothetical protein
MTSYGPVTAAGDVNLAELETSRSSLACSPALSEGTRCGYCLILPLCIRPLPAKCVACLNASDSPDHCREVEHIRKDKLHPLRSECIHCLNDGRLSNLDRLYTKPEHARPDGLFHLQNKCVEDTKLSTNKQHSLSFHALIVSVHAHSHH